MYHYKSQNPKRDNAIEKLYESGMSVTDIAKRYDLNASRINQILRTARELDVTGKIAIKHNNVSSGNRKNAGARIGSNAKKSQRNKKIVSDYLKGISVGKLAKNYGISQQRISQIGISFGAHRDRLHGCWEKTEIDERLVRDRRLEGKTYKEISIEIGVSATTITDRFGPIPRFNLRPGEKRCNMCKQIKPISQFSKLKSAKDGLQYRCKRCNAIGMKGYKKSV